MQSIREKLEEILQLCDDTSYSHLARMMKIKGLASQSLSELNDAPRTAKPAVKPASPKAKDSGGKTGDEVQKQNPPQAGEVTL